MKAVTWHGKRDVRVDTVPDPKIQEPTDAIIEVTSTNICGSDLHLYETLGAFMNGDAMTERDGAGVRITDDSFFLMFNSYSEPMEFKLPAKKWGREWSIVLDTATDAAPDSAQSHLFEERIHVAGHAMVVLRRVV